MAIKTETEIIITGAGAKDFLAYQNITQSEHDSHGNFVVGRFAEGERRVETGFGVVAIDYSLVTASNNTEVIIFSDKLRRRGRRTTRKVSVTNDEGIGTQQLTKNVNLIVRTSAPRAVFEKKRR